MLSAFGQDKERKANSNQSNAIVLKEINNPVQLSPRKDKEIDLSLGNKINQVVMRHPSCYCSSYIWFTNHFYHTTLIDYIIKTTPGIN